MKENTNKGVQKVSKNHAKNFSYHGSVWGQNRIFRILKNVIKENMNKVFKNCPKTMQTRVKLTECLDYPSFSCKIGYTSIPLT